MVSDARDAAQRVVSIIAGGIHFPDDRVFGSGYSGQRGQCLTHAVASVVMAHWLKGSGRVWQPQFRCVGE